MSRPIVLSNGEMHVGLNGFGLVHDFYYPYVGHENHAAANDLRHHVGVWVDGVCSWLDDGNWSFRFDYPHESLIGLTVARNAGLGITLELEDAIDSEQSALLRNIHVINEWDNQRQINLYMHQVFRIGDSAGHGETVQYLPENNAILHYKGRRAFVVGGTHMDGQPFNQFTCGLFQTYGREGSYRDAEDGKLESNMSENGLVDSVIGFCFKIAPHESARAYYWIAAGRSLREALIIDKRIRKDGLPKRLCDTNDYWHKWITPAYALADQLEPDARARLIKNVLIMKSHIDKRGAVMASTDTSMLNYYRDAYAYCWPRDASLVMWPLIRLGFRDEAMQFFGFCRRVLHPNGYLMHKFTADGGLGSSWHPYLHDGYITPPIQEDETALVLFMIGEFYHRYRDERFLADFYDSLVVPMAEFLAGYIMEPLGLPIPSYDLWEEVPIVSTYTVSVVYAALHAAAELAEARADAPRAVAWQTSADTLREAAHKHLYSHGRRSIVKGLHAIAGGTVTPIDTIDSAAVFGAYMFGLFDATSDEVTTSLATLKDALHISEQAPGLPRYENDAYNRIGDGIGNPWIITTLWHAQYAIEHGDIETGKKLLAWTNDRMMSTGVLPEQINPYDNSHVSVAPLAWSQAEYVNTVIDLHVAEQKP